LPSYGNLLRADGDGRDAQGHRRHAGVGRGAKAVKDAGIIDKLNGYGADPIGDDPQNFRLTIAGDIAMWLQAIKLAGVTLQ
jgi:hypothetical protein